MHMLMRVQVLGRPARQPLKFGKLFFNFRFYPPHVLSRRDFVEQHRSGRNGFAHLERPGH